MSNTIPSERHPRILFLGMQSQFSYPSLNALLEHGVEVCAVVIPASSEQGKGSPAISRLERPQIGHSTLPMLHAPLHSSILEIAWQRQIPVWEVYRLSDPETVSLFAAYVPDMICVVCFPTRIPRVLLELPQLGCLNVHPSLLPANRGPVPLFWTFREGCEQAGITIHFMDEGMDSGDILTQEPIAVPEGIHYAQLEMQCATRGGELLAQTVWNLYKGLAIAKPQDETKSSYFPFPSDEDFMVDLTQWTARHVYNFICGVASWNGPIRLYTADRDFLAQKAISYSHEDTSDNNRAVEYLPDEEVQLRCKVGWVKIKEMPG